MQYVLDMHHLMEIHL